MIERTAHLHRCRQLLEYVPCVALIGARQVGKTTLARELAQDWEGPVHHFDLERPSDLARLSEAELALDRLTGLIIIDEVQRRPDLFPLLRVLIDADPGRRFLVLGSASPHLLRQSSESLAGRISFHELTPFTLDETGIDSIDTLWLRGGFPRSYLGQEQTSVQWRRDFVRTFLERDLPALGSEVPSVTTGRFWRMLAHSHGQVWNGARYGSSLGAAATTVRRYLDLLTSALVVTQLTPWHENVGKRQVRSPKAFIADSGILHSLLDIGSMGDLEGHPILGASWEGFIISQLSRLVPCEPEQRFFWATHGGAELDLLIVRGAERIGFEIKRTTNPRVTASLRSAQETLKLDRSYVVHAGRHSFPLSAGVEALSAHDLLVKADW